MQKYVHQNPKIQLAAKVLGIPVKSTSTQIQQAFDNHPNKHKNKVQIAYVTLFNPVIRNPYSHAPADLILMHKYMMENYIPT
jgi:hypothetical protein